MEEFLEILAGIAIAAGLGSGVSCLLTCAAPEPPRPEQIAEKVWKQIIERTPGGGTWIGALERYLSLAVFWKGGQFVFLIAAWLAFKVAGKWEAWRNIVQVPPVLDEIPPLEWYGIRSVLGSWILTRFWLGTLVNVLIGLVAAYIGSHTYDFFGWLSSQLGRK